MLYTIFYLVWLALFLIAAFEIITGSKPVGQKVLWFLIVMLLPILGVILYYLIGRGK
ncbi:MAG: PLDc N-terminal domain-containing protein [Phycisphaerales bacterium]